MSLTNRALRARIERLARQWRPILGLESWDIELRYDEEKYLATAHVKPGGYEEAILHFNLARIKAELPPTNAALEELVLHELCHCHEAAARHRAPGEPRHPLAAPREVRLG